MDVVKGLDWAAQFPLAGAPVVVVAAMVDVVDVVDGVVVMDGVVL